MNAGVRRAAAGGLCAWADADREWRELPTTAGIAVQVEYGPGGNVFEDAAPLRGQRWPFVREFDQALLFQVSTPRTNEPVLNGGPPRNSPQAFKIISRQRFVAGSGFHLGLRAVAESVHRLVRQRRPPVRPAACEL